jgi:hypothetical protein
VQVIGGVLDPHPVQAELPGDLAQPDAVVLVAADEAEPVRGEPEDRGVIEHPPGLVAQRRVDDLPVRELPDVPGNRRLQQRLGVGPDDLELAQRGEVHDDRALAAGPVLLDCAVVVEAGRQPIAAVLGDPPGQ